MELWAKRHLGMKDGSIITNGGAEQINTPVKDDVLWRLGNLK